MNHHNKPPLIHLEETEDSETVTVERIYVAYPRHVAKTAALKAIREVIESGKPAAWLLDRTEAYAAAVKHWPEADRIFVPYPGKWFHTGGFEDDPHEWERKLVGGAATSEPQSSRCYAVEGPDGELIFTDSNARPLRQKYSSASPDLAARMTEEESRKAGLNG
jgi:hypothetical protein